MLAWFCVALPQPYRADSKAHTTSIGTRRHKAIGNLNGYIVEFSKVKKELMYGYRKVDDVFVADPEKAVIDMLYLNRFVGYAEGR